MRFSLKNLLTLVAIVAVLCAVATWYLNSLQASDVWGYGKLGVNDGTAQSSVFYFEVRGVGKQPTVARVVRFAGKAAAPRNALEISHAASSDLASHIHYMDRWNDKFTIIAGRKKDETVEIPLDAATARKLFAQPGTQFEDYKACNVFWDEHIAPYLPDRD